MNKKIEPLKAEIGKRIDYIRNEKHLSKEGFAELINVTGQHLGKVISGEAGLSVEKIRELSQITGYSTDFILLNDKIKIDVNIKEQIKSEIETMKIACASISNLSELL